MFPGEEWGHANEGDVGVVVFFDVAPASPPSDSSSPEPPPRSPRGDPGQHRQHQRGDRIAKQFIEAVGCPRVGIADCSSVDLSSTVRAFG